MNSKIFLIVSCARSGSTSLARILDIAANCKCLVEPMPNLNIETREIMDGRLTNPRKVLVDQVLPRIADVLDEGYIYGEKNVTMGPFIPYLYEMLKCKFLLLIRDGRDVAASLMNWHNEVFGDIYRECKETGPLSKIARTAAKKINAMEDTSDYARPRPNPLDPFYEEWADFSRFEMVTWYWSHINQLFLSNLGDIPKEDWMTLNYTGVQAGDIEGVFNFLGLEGFDELQVNEMLRARINSVWARVKLKPRFQRWQSWDEERTQVFNRIAYDTMCLLGYYN